MKRTSRTGRTAGALALSSLLASVLVPAVLFADDTDPLAPPATPSSNDPGTKPPSTKRETADSKPADAKPADTKPADPIPADPRTGGPQDGERKVTPNRIYYVCPKCNAEALVAGKCIQCNVDRVARSFGKPVEAKPSDKPADKPAPPAPTAPGTTTAPGDDGSDAKARAYKDENIAKGDYYFKTGYYLKASESYRVAVLAEPVNAWKKLSFGHALFAIGNYSYASYALRRAVTQLDAEAPFNPDVASLFPSKRAFEKAVKDLKQYVKYSPRDPAGLSVLGYMLYAQGDDDEKAKEMFIYLKRLPSNENDKFADFFMKQIDARKGRVTPKPAETEPELGEPKAPVKEVKPAPPAAKAQPVPEASREDETPAPVKPETAPARSE